MEVERLGGYVLKLADGGDAPFCHGTCGCFTEPSAGLIAMAVALPGATAGDLAGSLFGSLRRGDQDIRADDDPGREAEGTAGVLTGGGAETRAVLRLDLARRTGELRLADGTGQRDPLFLLEPAQPVGAVAGAGGLSAKPESSGVGLVQIPAGGAFTLHFPWHNVNSTGQSQGFMGKTWDGWESPASFQRWCNAWATECLRVLKPGGYLLAFGGTRTSHRLTCGIEDAGFEIRDALADLTGIDGPGLLWLYGSGFPKSLDVSKAIDRRRDDRADTHQVTAFVAAARKKAGLANRDIDAAFGFNGMAGHWTNTHGPQAAVPTWEQWQKLRDLLGFGDEMDAEVWRLNGRKGEPGEAWGEREVIGQGGRSGTARYSMAGDFRGEWDETAPATEDAARWEGWGRP